MNYFLMESLTRKAVQFQLMAYLDLSKHLPRNPHVTSLENPVMDHLISVPCVPVSFYLVLYDIITLVYS